LFFHRRDFCAAITMENLFNGTYGVSVKML
jgi:hypothetical protein